MNPVLREELASFVRTFLETNIQPVEAKEFKDWLAGVKAPEHRKEEIRAEWEINHGQLPPAWLCWKIASFIKSEHYEEIKEARWINSRHDAFKAYSGRFFSAVERELFQGEWTKHPGNNWFIKHVPVPDRPKMIAALKKTGLHYFENDFSSFEAHIRAELMEVCELQLYRHALQKYPADAEFICSVISGTNKLKTRAGVKAQTRARRMSGDMCTSLGNGFTNLMVTLFIVHRKGGHVEGFVEGDDGLFATSVPLMNNDYLELGFTSKVSEVADPKLGHFCQMLVSEDLELVKDPRRVLNGFGWTASTIHGGSAIMDQLLRAKALSLCYELPQCPIVGALGRMALHITDGITPRFDPNVWVQIPDDYDGPDSVFAPAPSTRQLVADLFGITVEQQLAVEALIFSNQLECIPDFLPANSDVQWYAARYLEVG